MTYEQQHQIERMRAWVAFTTVPGEEDPFNIGDIMLRLFDERFPLMVNPLDGWNIHKAGDPMPCSNDARVDMLLSDGTVERYVRAASRRTNWDGTADFAAIAWRPAT